MNLTPKQLEVLKAIHDHQKATRTSPTLVEIALKIGVAKITAFERIEALVKKGALFRIPHAARGLSISPAGMELLGVGPNPRVAELEAEVAVLKRNCRLLAKLAAKTPQFYNPLEVMEAEHVRDRWLSGAGTQAVQS